MSWVCSFCTFENDIRRKKCQICNIKKNEPKLRKVGCPVCTLLNPIHYEFCEACGSELSVNNESDVRESDSEKNRPDSNQSDRSAGISRPESPVRDSDDEDKYYFDVVKKHFDEFVSVVHLSACDEPDRYKCRIDDRICGTKQMMCAYISRRHRDALESFMRGIKQQEEAKARLEDEDRKLALLLQEEDYDDAVANPEARSKYKKGRGKKKNEKQSIDTSAENGSIVRKNTGWVNKDQSSSARPSTVSSIISNKKHNSRTYSATPSAFFQRTDRGNYAKDASYADVQDCNDTDKEARLMKLLSKSDQIVKKVNALVAPVTVSPNCTSGSELPDNTSGIDAASMTQSALVTGCVLRPYQISGVQWLCGMHSAGFGGILADEMGLGKTLQVLTFFCTLFERFAIRGPHLVVMPLSVLSSWQGDITKHCASAIDIYTHIGNREEREEGLQTWVSRLCSIEKRKWSKIQLCLTSYDMVLKDASLLARFGMMKSQQKLQWAYIVVDEAHRLKNSQSKLFSALRTFHARRHLLLTGTPLQNNLKELWSLLNFISPKIFSDFSEFSDWFTKPFDDVESAGRNGRKGKQGGGIVADEVLSDEERGLIVASLHRVLKPFLLRREKADVALDLPRKVEKVVYCPLSALQRSLHESILAHSDSSVRSIYDMRDSTEEILPTSSESNRTPRYVNMSYSNVAMQLRKVCNHPYLVLESCRSIPDDKYFKDLVPASGKLVVLARLLNTLLPNGHRVLIFSQMTTTLDVLQGFLQEKGYGCCRLDGNTDRQTRERVISNFHRGGSKWSVDDGDSTSNSDIVVDELPHNLILEADDVPVFLLSTRAGGVGINLQSADTVILFDSDWNPQMDLQAIGRAHRIGQDRDVLVLRLVSAFSSDDSGQMTVEERILQRATGKLLTERTVLAKRKFDLSENNAEGNMKLIKQQMQCPRGINNGSSEQMTDPNTMAEGIVCDDIVDLIHNGAWNDIQAIRNTCSRTSSSGVDIDHAAQSYADDRDYEASGTDILMNDNGLAEWGEWLESIYDAGGDGSVLSVDMQEVEKCASDKESNADRIPGLYLRRRSRKRYVESLSEDAIWKKALERASVDAPRKSYKPEAKLAKKKRRKVEPDIEDSDKKVDNVGKPESESDDDLCAVCGTHDYDSSASTRCESEDDASSMYDSLKIYMREGRGDTKETSMNSPSNSKEPKLRTKKLRPAPNVLILCDGCDMGFHLRCVGLSEVPSGEWFCDVCCNNLGIRSYGHSAVPSASVRAVRERNIKHPEVKNECSGGDSGSEKGSMRHGAVNERNSKSSCEKKEWRKSYDCPLCKSHCADIEALQLHLVMDCAEWKIRNLSTSNPEMSCDHLLPDELLEALGRVAK